MDIKIYVVCILILFVYSCTKSTQDSCLVKDPLQLEWVRDVLNGRDCKLFEEAKFYQIKTKIQTIYYLDSYRSILSCGRVYYDCDGHIINPKDTLIRHLALDTSKVLVWFKALSDPYHCQPVADPLKELSWLQQVIAGKDCPVDALTRIWSFIHHDESYYLFNSASSLGICSEVIYNCLGEKILFPWDAKWQQFIKDSIGSKLIWPK